MQDRSESLDQWLARIYVDQAREQERERVREGGAPRAPIRPRTMRRDPMDALRPLPEPPEPPEYPRGVFDLPAPAGYRLAVSVDSDGRLLQLYLAFAPIFKAERTLAKMERVLDTYDPQRPDLKLHKPDDGTEG